MWCRMILLPKDYLSVDIGMTLKDHKAKGVVMVTVTHTKRYQLGAFIPYTYICKTSVMLGINSTVSSPRISNN